MLPKNGHQMESNQGDVFLHRQQAEGLDVQVPMLELRLGQSMGWTGDVLHLRSGIVSTLKCKWNCDARSEDKAGHSRPFIGYQKNILLLEFKMQELLQDVCVCVLWIFMIFYMCFYIHLNMDTWCNIGMWGVYIYIYVCVYLFVCMIDIYMMICIFKYIIKYIRIFVMIYFDNTYIHIIVIIISIIIISIIIISIIVCVWVDLNRLGTCQGMHKAILKQGMSRGYCQHN